MGVSLSNLTPPAGSSRKPLRLGRGDASGSGTTAGRGQKGQRSRSGSVKRAWFEGGQMPLQRRLPKRGFKSPFRVEYTPVNVGQLAIAFGAGEEVDLDRLKSKGLVPRKAARWKLLGNGQIAHALTIRAQSASQSGSAKIAEAGGTVDVVGSARRK